MYIKGGLKKLSKAIAKSAKENMDAQIKIAEQEEKEMMEAEKTPVFGDSQMAGMSIQEKLGTWSHNFSQLDDKEKFYYMLEQGRGIVKLDDDKRINGYRIYGCVSQVWLLPQLKGENMEFEVDADSHEARGAMYILQSILSGHPPKEILEVDDNQIAGIGFIDVLTPKRRDGLFAVVNAIRDYAKDMNEIMVEQTQAEQVVDEKPSKKYKKYTKAGE